ncbi:hypothetical protein DTO96_101276 [Ephemeroptericola cinctiostellae]|uniref:Uncharacterized protein n=1 Tax=Ephemeroptericola cinctiostellae TaxID=2268024 RepID=A0A345DB07_9BURK|nr:hypothetical protein [Ephemeroptericola cinctiostellae]AXF85545.1 hypothetical protein DTO96_101276 [Ephemeroptericola cinctiostellae]
MLKNKNISLQDTFNHSIRFTKLAPAFAGFWAGLVWSISIYLSEDVDWEIILTTCFFIVLAYPYGFVVAAITGALLSHFTSLSKQKFACLTALTSSTLTLFQSGIFYIINALLDRERIVWEDDQIHLSFPLLLDPIQLPKLTILMLTGSLIGGYFFGLFYIKRYGAK